MADDVCPHRQWIVLALQDRPTRFYLLASSWSRPVFDRFGSVPLVRQDIGRLHWLFALSVSDELVELKLEAT